MPAMKRKIYDTLLKWKRESEGRSAILLDGARRVGKSYIAEEFARNEYESYLLIDFSVAPKEVKGFFDDYLGDLDTFFMYLLNFYNVKLAPRKSVIIFDEVQDFPRAREAIKHLVKDRRFDYIETGSLISIDKNTKNILIPSEEHREKMYPMDFEEFLWATGNSGTMPIIAHHYDKRLKLGENVHRRFMGALRQYLLVGGMPQAVEEFLRSRDLQKVDRVKRDILDLYRADILKHGGRSKHKILSVFNAIPGQLSRHERRFSPGEVERGAGMRSFETSFEWLKSAMMCNVAYNATEPNVGLELSSDHSSLKCYMADTGLLVSMAFSERELVGGEIQQRLLTGRLETNLGMVWENLVAQQLKALGHSLFFYSSTNRHKNKAEDIMEIDFLILKSSLERRHNIVPIEVKGTGEYETKSLRKFIARYSGFLATPLVLHTKDLSRESDCLNLPLYMTACL